MKQVFTEGVLEPMSRNKAVVSQIGYIDLRVAYATGEVPSDLEGVEGNFNGIDDPNSIMGTPDDVFSAMRAADAAKAVVAAKSAESPEGEGGE